MGRIKSLMIKKAARQLMENENSFNDKFDNNKKILSSNTMPSKSIRNKVAGYLARLTIVQREAKTKPIKPKVEEVEVNY